EADGPCSTVCLARWAPRKVQLRGGPRGPHARRTPRTFPLGGGLRLPSETSPPGRSASRRAATGWAPCVRGEQSEIAPAKPALERRSHRTSFLRHSVILSRAAGDDARLVHGLHGVGRLHPFGEGVQGLPALGLREAT